MRGPRLSARRLPALLLFAVVIAAVGCALQQSVESGSLAGACQMRACECARPAGPFGVATEIAPVEWLVNGDAVCPEGFRLRVASK